MRIFYTTVLLQCYKAQFNSLVQLILSITILLNCNKILSSLLTTRCKISSPSSAAMSMPFSPKTSKWVDNCDPGHNLPRSREL